jgi:3-oxosteroid 1-dehydrogenase
MFSDISFIHHNRGLADPVSISPRAHLWIIRIANTQTKGESMSEFDEVVDFAIVGSGAGSMCAALVMRAAGKITLILEKTHLIGGSTSRSGGVMWIPNNPFMQRDGVEDSPEKAAIYLDTLLGEQKDAPGASPERRRQFLEQAPRMLQFLQSQSIEFTRVKHWPDYYDNLPGGSAPGRTVVAELFDVNQLGVWKERLRGSTIIVPVSLMPWIFPRVMRSMGIQFLTASLEDMLRLQSIRQSWRIKMLAMRIVIRTLVAELSGKHYVAGGAALQGRMLQASLRAGVDIRTDSPVSALIVEGNAVRGVLAVKDGRPWRIGARLGVLVDAGGFAQNQRMRDRYTPGTSVKWTMASPGDTGEMLEEMMRIGAASAQMDERVGNQATLPPGFEELDIKPAAQSVTAKPHAILVDQTGVRYMTEGGSYMQYCTAMLERNKTVRAVPSFAILDAQYMAKYMLAGTFPGSPKPQAWFDSGYMKKADTIEGLAMQLKIEPAALKRTVDRWNGFVARSHDEDFHRGEKAYDTWLGDPYHKPSASLGTIAVAPFYAVPVVPGDVSTFGGVVCDQHARVLRGDGSVIAGLYATGACSASVMGRAYPGAGASIGPSFTWGYVAASHATAGGVSRD